MHDTVKAQISDKHRQDLLEQDGHKVMRIKNEEIISDLEKVKEEINNQIQQLNGKTGK